MRQITYFLLIFLILFSTASVKIYGQKSCKAYIYSFPESYVAEKSLSYLDNRPDWEVVFCNLNDTRFSEVFLKLVKILIMEGVKVTPSEVCIQCELLHLTIEEIWMAHASPLIGFFRNGRLKATTLGIFQSEILDKALAAEDNDMKVFALDDIYSLDGESVKVLEELFLGEAEAKMNAQSLISSLSLLALADSVNPCTFAVFTALLLMALHSLGKTKATLTGFSFIIAIFLCYYILGFGLIHILGSIMYVDKVVASVGLIVGTFYIAQGLKPNFKSPLPKSLRRFMELQISKSYVSPLASFVLGAVASFTLLPCSSGPYIVAAGLLSTLKDLIQVCLLLLLYNALFVMPLIAILLTVLASSAYVRKIKVLRSRKLGVMELISGSLLVMICVYLLLS